MDAYKNELAEIERKKSAGLTDEKDADAARSDIEKRILAAVLERAPARPAGTHLNYAVISAAGAIVIIGLFGIYQTATQPEAIDPQSLAAAAASIEPASGGWAQRVAKTQTTDNNLQDHPDVATMVERLERRLDANPNDLDGWRMLGWSYSKTGRLGEAVTAYRHAVDLRKDDPALKSLYGEAMVQAAGGTVDKDALAVFEQVLAADPSDPRARYYQGVAKAQQGDNQGALDEWLALYKTAPAGAEWAGDLRARIEEVAKSSGINVSAQLQQRKAETAVAAPAPIRGPSAKDIENAKQLSSGDRQAMVRGMVSQLAARLEASPDDADGWIMLIRSHMVLNEPDQARSALERAQKSLAGAPEKLTRVIQAARALGVSPAVQ